jgi:hypothetical protein
MIAKSAVVWFLG